MMDTVSQKQGRHSPILIAGVAAHTERSQGETGGMSSDEIVYALPCMLHAG
jgi:hypothetical protein